MVKPEMLVEETVKCKSTGTRSKMVLLAARRLHMNPEESGQAVGDPNGTGQVRLLPRESEMPVVVKISGKVKTEGAKGHCYNK